MDLVAGQEYSFILTPEDPIFSETTNDADDCYNQYLPAFCVSADITAISANGVPTKTFNKQSTPLVISFANESQSIDEVQECTVHVDGFDGDGNTWTVEIGNWTARVFDAGTESKTGPNPEAELTFNCTSHFDAGNDDDALFDDLAIRIDTNDGAGPASAYIDYVYVVTNFSVQDVQAPAWSNPNASPESPATYGPGQEYHFNVTWTDNDVVDTVIMEHNFTGTLANYTISGNTGNVYFYNYTDIPAGSYVWRQIANDSAGNFNSTHQEHTT